MPKPMRNLTKQDWKEIRRLIQLKQRNITQIARDYGINRTSIYAYTKRRNWFKPKPPIIQSPAKRSFLKDLWKKITH